MNDMRWNKTGQIWEYLGHLFSTFSSSLSSPAEAISSLLLLPVIPVTAEGSSFLTAPDACNQLQVEVSSNNWNDMIITLAEEMRFFKPSTLLLKCLAWSSKLWHKKSIMQKYSTLKPGGGYLAVWSWVRVSRSMTGSRGWVPTSNLQYRPRQNTMFCGMDKVEEMW